MDSQEANEELSALGIKDYFTKLDAGWQFSNPATVWRFPLETVSQSESGFERSYQGSVILAQWRLVLPPQGQWRNKIVFHMQDLEG